MKEKISLAQLLKTGLIGSLPLGILVGSLAFAKFDVIDFNESPVYGVPGFLLGILFTSLAMVPLLIFVYLSSKFGEFLLGVIRKRW